MTPRQSLLRRCFAVLSAALLAGALTAIGISAPAGATGGKGSKGSLSIVKVTDIGTRLPGPVQNRPFKVVVKVLDAYGNPTTVSKRTKIKLKEVSGPGELDGVTTAVIPRGGSSATISGATYSKFANGVVLAVFVKYGDRLAPDKITVDVALTAVSAFATPGEPLTLIDPDCKAPTSNVPTCGQFVLENGARGRVIMAIHSCKGLQREGDPPCRKVGDTQALVVTGIANLKDLHGKPLYNKKDPATLVVICDKVLCGKTRHHQYGKTGHPNGLPKIPIIYTLKNTGPLDKVAPPCPKKGVIGKKQEACTDFAQSFRRKGDLYEHLLYTVDARGSM